MQYILSEQEYQDLKESASNSIHIDVIADHCVKLACTIPVRGWWNEDLAEPTPWGCPNCWRRHSNQKLRDAIKQQIDYYEPEEYQGDDYVEYCDDCPMQALCPLQKRYSK